MKNSETPQDCVSPEIDHGAFIADRERILRQRDYRTKVEERYKDTPVELWPNFEVRWSLEASEFYWSLDQTSQADFAKDPPLGLEVIDDVDLAKLDCKLTRISSQTPDEFWTIGFSDKKALAIDHWVQGKSMTPPLVCLTTCGKELLIKDGNHRLAVARVKAVTSLPILVLPSEKLAIMDLLKTASCATQSKSRTTS